MLDMKEVDLFDQLPDLFEQIRPGLWKVKRPRRPRRWEEGRAGALTCVACTDGPTKPAAETSALRALGAGDRVQKDLAR